MSAEEHLIVPLATEIPDKLYFRIGEVARLAGIKPYVLRFWETEFTSLKPKPSGSGQRLYRRKDVEHVLEIKRLLYQERFTIEGARKHMETKAKAEVSGSGKPGKARKGPGKAQASLFGADPSPALEKVRDELKALLVLLK
jgi:DNA-binding transcriptional MerR regulator